MNSLLYFSIDQFIASTLALKEKIKKKTVNDEIKKIYYPVKSFKK